uniref:Uncharacterized protein n=1 Tax=viral metagenome TaxID=1070528 RepID=A0A6M3LTG4_9ZZZZ
MEHGSIGWDTLKEMLFVGGEPSLFEVALLEVMAKVDAHTNILIQSGQQVESLIKMAQMRVIKLNELDEKLEEIKGTLMDQIGDLERVANELAELKQ